MMQDCTKREQKNCKIQTFLLNVKISLLHKLRLERSNSTALIWAVSGSDRCG